MLVTILNNDINHAIPTTEFLYNYINSEIVVRNREKSLWTKELINYLISLKDIKITSIVTKRDNEIIDDFNNLNGELVAINNEVI